MAKKKCEICGAKIKEGASRCSGCGMPLIDLNKIAMKKFNASANKTSGDGPLADRTLNLIQKLKFMSKLEIVVALFSLILLFVHALINLNVLLILLCLILFFCLPYIGLPITWMQLILEHIFEMNNKKK